MGKSEKKVKSERISALRLQYDAYLEEDKKRRQRNEYIIERLDKMRMSTAIVLRNRLSQLVIDPHNSAYDRRSNDDKPQAPIQTLIPVRSYASCRLDDNDLLKEISKKYILIPKQTHVLTTDELLRQEASTVSDANDWKSKYDILTKLKQEEKVSKNLASIEKIDKADKSALEHFHYADVPEKDSNSTIEHNDRNKVQFQENIGNIRNYSSEGNCELIAENTDRSLNKENNDIYEFDAANSADYNSVTVSEELSPSEYTIDNVNTLNTNNLHLDQDQHEAPDKVIYANVTKKNTSENVHVEGENNIIHGQNYESTEPGDYVPEEISTIANEKNDFKHFEYNHDQRDKYGVELSSGENQITTPNAPENQSLEAVDITRNYDYTSNAQETGHETTDSDPVTSTMSNLNQNPIKQAHNYTDNTEQPEFPIELINTEDFTPNKGVIVTDGVNINPPGYEEEHVAFDEPNNVPDVQYPLENVSSEEVHNAVDVSQIKEFDEENKKMFYSEEQNINYDQYNTQGESVPNTEQPEPVGAYDENGQYVYYEGTAQSQPYPVEYDENQTPIQHYDQSYEQQYGNTAYEQQQYEGQYNQQYQQQGVEQPHIYENVEQYSEQQNTNTEEIQKQLDYEEGYNESVVLTEDTNVVTDDTNVNPVDSNMQPANMTLTEPANENAEDLNEPADTVQTS